MAPSSTRMQAASGVILPPPSHEGSVLQGLRVQTMPSSLVYLETGSVIGFVGQWKEPYGLGWARALMWHASDATAICYDAESLVQDRQIVIEEELYICVVFKVSTGIINQGECYILPSMGVCQLIVKLDPPSPVLIGGPVLLMPIA